jgi:hypothetical protein
MDGLDSNYIPSDPSSTNSIRNDQNPSIDLAIKGVSSFCLGKYHVSPGWISGSLLTTATSGGGEIDDNDDNTAVDLTWEFVSSYRRINSTKYMIPESLNTTQCSSNLAVSKLHFTGSISAHVINLFAGMIRHSVSSELNEQLCPVVQDQIDPLFTDALQSVDKALSKYLPPGSNTTDMLHLSPTIQSTERILHVPNPFSIAASPPETAQAQSLDIAKDAPLLLKALESANHFLSCYYAARDNTQDNPRANCKSLATRGLSGILGMVLDGLATEVQIPIPRGFHSIHFDLSNYGKVLLDIQDLYIMGLDQLDHLSLISPASQENSNIISRFQSEMQTAAGLNITADVNITILPVPGGIFHGDALQETFHIHLNFSAVTSRGDFEITFDRDRFQQTQVGTILDVLPGVPQKHNNSTHNSTMEKICLAKTIQSLHISALSTHAIIESVTFVPQLPSKLPRHRRLVSSLLTKKLEEDLDHLLNNFLQLFLNEYQPLLTDAITGATGGPLLAWANRWIDEKLHNYTNNHDYDKADLDISTVADFSHTDLTVEEDERCRMGDDSMDNHHHELANFSKLAFLGEMNQYLNRPSTLASINHAIDKVASKAEARHNESLSRLSSPLHTWLSTTTLPGVSIKLRDLQIENVGSIQHIGKQNRSFKKMVAA